METFTIFLYFFAYAFLGWACESIYVSVGRKQLINSGFLHLPICPIYGVGAIAVIYLLSPFVDYPILIIVFGIIITSIIEYITSWGMEKLFHIRWWDYSEQKYNLQGRICLKNSLMFGILGLVVMYFIHPIVTDFLMDIDLPIQSLLASALAAIMVADAVVSTINVLNINKLHKKLESALQGVREDIEIRLEKRDQELDVFIKKMEKRQERWQKKFPTLSHLDFDFKEKLGKRLGKTNKKDS